MKHEAILDWNHMGLMQEFIDDGPPPDEGRNFYRLLPSDGAQSQFTDWAGSEDQATLWLTYLCNAMSIGVAPFPPRLIFLFTIPVELASGPSYCSQRESVSLYRETPFLMAGEQPEHRESLLFSTWNAFYETCQCSRLLAPIWDWSVSTLDQRNWWVITLDPAIMLPECVREGKIWHG